MRSELLGRDIYSIPGTFGVREIPIALHASESADTRCNYFGRCHSALPSMRLRMYADYMFHIRLCDDPVCLSMLGILRLADTHSRIRLLSLIPPVSHYIDVADSDWFLDILLARNIILIAYHLEVAVDTAQLGSHFLVKMTPADVQFLPHSHPTLSQLLLWIINLFSIPIFP